MSTPEHVSSVFPEEDAFVLAPLGKRFFATFIDYLLYLAVVIMTIRVFGHTYETSEGKTGWHIEGWPAIIPVLYWFIIPIMEALIGQSIGKLLFGIKILKHNGAKASFVDAFARHLLDFVDYLPGFGIVGIIVASRNRLRQRVGDLVSGTIVVNK